ncbi:MAG: DUF1599 domain-containing protein [Bacteroidales bacterium]|nr:DUF1599 domain-containing protein [Bacteroidales bacterium]
MTTDLQFDKVINKCRDLFKKKASDYGTAWRIMRPESITDQIFIKANRIRGLEINKTSMIDEGVVPEFIGMINYSIMGLIQLEKGFADTADITAEIAVEYYNKYAEQAKNLMMKKNHDYGEAWRSMRISSITDLILMKIYRIKQIENNDGKTSVSEGIDAGYFDIINYSVFNLIKLGEIDNNNDTK